MITFDRPVTGGCVATPEIRTLLKRERIVRGWGYAEVGRRIGVGAATVQRLENGTGHGSCRYQVLSLWAGVFGLEIELRIVKREMR